MAYIDEEGGGIASPFDAGTTSILISLQAGQEVAIQNDLASTIYGQDIDKGMYSFFSGYLLAEL